MIFFFRVLFRTSSVDDFHFLTKLLLCFSPSHLPPFHTQLQEKQHPHVHVCKCVCLCQCVCVCVCSCSMPISGKTAGMNAVLICKIPVFPLVRIITSAFFSWKILITTLTGRGMEEAKGITRGLNDWPADEGGTAAP